MKKILFLFVFCFPAISYASTYAVGRDDGGVSIVNYVDSSSDSLEEVITSQGLSKNDVKKVSKTDLPSRQDREFWQLNDLPLGKKIKINSSKKDSFEQEKQGKETKKQAVLKKLSLTKEELLFLKEALNDSKA